MCETYVEGDRLEDVGNIRALYEEYGEWLDTFNGMPASTRRIHYNDQLAYSSEELKMTITNATSADWVDFWENEMPSTVEMNQDQIAAMLTVSENIQEQIEIAG